MSLGVKKLIMLAYSFLEHHEMIPHRQGQPHLNACALWVHEYGLHWEKVKFHTTSYMRDHWQRLKRNPKVQLGKLNWTGPAEASPPPQGRTLTILGPSFNLLLCHRRTHGAPQPVAARAGTTKVRDCGCRRLSHTSCGSACWVLTFPVLGLCVRALLR